MAAPILLPTPATLARCHTCGHAASLYLLPDVRRMYCKNPVCHAFHPSDTLEAASARYKAHVEGEPAKPAGERSAMMLPFHRN